MLASYSRKAHNYQKLAVCTACTGTGITCDFTLGGSEPLRLSIVQ